MMGVVRLLVLAEERLLGLGIASLLSRRYKTHVTESFQRAAALLEDEAVDAVLWLGDRLDAGAVAQLAELECRHPQLRVCVLARAADPEALSELLDRITGAAAVLLRGDDLDIGQVVASLDRVLAGRSALEPGVLQRMIADDAEGADALACLTLFEQEVLELVAHGLRNGEIARRMRKSEKAVEKRVSSVFEKLGLDARTARQLDRRVAAARIFFTCRPYSADHTQ